MSQQRNFKVGDSVKYSERPDLVFSVKSGYVSDQTHYADVPKLRVVAETTIDGRYFSVDAPDYYFTYAEEWSCQNSQH